MNNKKKDYVWNTLAGLVNASEAVIMSMIVTRLTSLADAGILTLAFAVANLMVTIGKYGVRNYQVTDAQERFGFCTYFRARVLTTAGMLLAAGCYLLYASYCQGYTADKLLVVALLCLVYALESVEDVFWGELQRIGYLQKGAKMFCIRWGVIYFVFFAVLYICRNLWAALAISFASSVIAFCASYVLIFRKTQKPHRSEKQGRKAAAHEIKEVLFMAFPLFGVSYLSLYLSNAPKYAVDACLSDEMTACYGFVAMPVFVIGLLNNFIYQPTLTDMAEEWEKKELKRFSGRIRKQLLVIGALTGGCVAGAYLLGIPVLSLLYHTELDGYKKELLILLVAGGLMAAAGYIGIVLTVMRRQKYLLWGYLPVTLLAMLTFRKIVGRYQTMGAAVWYTVLMLLLVIIFMVYLKVEWSKE